MDKKKLIYLALGALILLPSCTQDEPAKKEPAGDDNRIYFRSYLPAVSLTRAQVVTELNTCQVICYNPDDPDLIDTTSGLMTPYFPDTRFTDVDGNGKFYSQDADKCIWPNANSTLHFFAYYPSVDVMEAKTDGSYFNFEDASTFADEKLQFDLRLKKFRVAKDIADQVDFLTAYSAGTLSADGSAGIKLDFKHQLARVEITAWGANEKYDFEIAGVRIGNPIVEDDFKFPVIAEATDAALPWQNMSPRQEPVEHIFTPGETVVSLSKNAAIHASEDAAASLMGKAGAAMLIPMSARIEAWEGLADPKTAEANYATDKMYFSVLLRVKNSEGKVAYPYPNAHKDMKVIYFAVDKASGAITRRLYKIDGAYYTTSDPAAGSIYEETSTDEIREFGWAALPVPAKWDAGKKYTYKLNYSDGIGWHDPDDPEPGEPILERGGIPFTVGIADWVEADDYTPNIDVPKK